MTHHMNSEEELTKILRKLESLPIQSIGASVMISEAHKSIMAWHTKQVAKSERLARIDELDKVSGGTNTAAGIRTPNAGARRLNMDDLYYYLFNRKRALRGKNALTPEEWFEAER